MAPTIGEREKLYKAIWGLANELRGSVSGWSFKTYVLGTLFYRYLCEKITDFINEGEWAAGDKSFDYEKISNEEASEFEEDIVGTLGYFIYPSDLLNVIIDRAKDVEWRKEHLHEAVSDAFRHIEDSTKGQESEEKLEDLFLDFDVNNKGKLGDTVQKRNQCLYKVLDSIASVDLGKLTDHNNDIFGDAYEFLMSMYASNAGKSGGEYYTPSEVSELLTRLGTVGKTSVNKVYDPACGSGSLLLKSLKVLGTDGVRIGFFGQEKENETYNLCRINMFLHDVPFDRFDIKCDDTLINPRHWDNEPFDLIVSNPPYGIPWEGSSNPLLINDVRFAPAGVLAPKSKADFAFVMHCLSWLSACGTAAIVCFPGIMYRSGAEQKIRQYLVDNNFIDCIIQLPGNLFFGTPIVTDILVIKKNKTDNSILFIDASKEFVKVTNNNKLSPENIDHIVELFTARADVPHVSHMASLDEIVEQDYNLSVSTYVEAEDTREKVNIVELNAKIEEIVAREDALRADIRQIIAEIEG